MFYKRWQRLLKNVWTMSLKFTGEKTPKRFRNPCLYGNVAGQKTMPLCSIFSVYHLFTRTFLFNADEKIHNVLKDFIKGFNSMLNSGKISCNSIIELLKKHNLLTNKHNQRLFTNSQKVNDEQTNRFKMFVFNNNYIIITSAILQKAHHNNFRKRYYKYLYHSSEENKSFFILNCHVGIPTSFVLQTNGEDQRKVKNLLTYFAYPVEMKRRIVGGFIHADSHVIAIIRCDKNRDEFLCVNSAFGNPSPVHFKGPIIQCTFLAVPVELARTSLPALS